ncbi:hypothetical protein K431DRAFT_277204 [Polychaeton citri CBS 116435]|uniref:Anaphase-promoting complex subunit 4 n=1 Tax=Polychaeton citri CBS 116435 TaxID=1314669 RepID=A0A9P4Q2Q0_9PEZI|nr:hypothetical protein K431DRAFT_277204 [Polychaeton citri CBS 116435]
MATIELHVVTKPRLYLRPSTRSGKSKLCAISSAHDLIALPADKGDVIVLRLNGQVAFTCRRKHASINAGNDDAAVSALEWKPDGTLLAIGWSDGTWGVVSGENGRTFSRGAVRAPEVREAGWKLDLKPDFGDDESDEDGTQDEAKEVFLFGWSSSNTAFSGTALGQDGDDDDLDTSDNLDTLSDPATSKQVATAVSLPYKLATIDATEILPRLSALPSHGMPLMKAGPEGNKFSSQAAADALFPSTKTTTSLGAIGTLLICTGRGEIEVLLEESVSVGSIRMSELRPALHASNPRSSTHVLICRDSEERHLLASVRLSNLSLDNPLLHTVTSNTRRLQNLLSYTTYTVRCIQHDYATGLGFPTRLINNINTELGEKGEGNIVSNLYHLALTTNFTPTILEWLTDIVKEQNHKRWYSAVETMYQHLQTHIFAHVLPALDRLSVAAATLRGHAVFHEDSSEFGISASLFTNILSSVDAVRLLVQRILLIIMDESKQFRAFSRWLKVMIDIGSAGPFTKTANEIEEREFANLDHGLATQYIKSALTSSLLENFVGDLNIATLRGECTKAEWFGNDVIRSVTYDSTKVALARYDGVSKDSNIIPTDVIHSFEESQSSFRPTRIVLGDRPGKEVCIVFDDHRDIWMVLDISARARSNAFTAEKVVDDEDFFEDDMEVEWKA